MMHPTRERSKEPRPKGDKNRSSGERKRSQSLDNTRGSSSGCGQAARGKEAGLSSKVAPGGIQANGSGASSHVGVSRNGRRATGTGPLLSNQYAVKEKALS
ncbi:hypothetical protein HDU81_011248, partial [Chytriomyces hyalinus]